MTKEIEIEAPANVQMLLPAYADLLLIGDIDESLYANFLDQYLKTVSFLDDGPLTIRLTSGGGQMGIGFALYDLIKSCPFPTRIEVYGYACSAAALVLEAANERCMSKNARIMFHPVSFMSDQSIHLSTKELKYHSDEMDLSTNSLIKIVSQRSGLKIEQVRKFCEEEKYFSAKEAKKMNLIDEVL
jgi:ATP-dependent protease ClpP protease subunit